jgi:hypothetical protein
MGRWDGAVTRLGSWARCCHPDGDMGTVLLPGDRLKVPTTSQRERLGRKPALHTPPPWTCSLKVRESTFQATRSLAFLMVLRYGGQGTEACAHLEVGATAQEWCKPLPVQPLAHVVLHLLGPVCVQLCPDRHQLTRAVRTLGLEVCVVVLELS